MESPNTTRGGVRAFRGASTATFASPVDATSGHDLASHNDARFYWDRRSNSVERLSLHMGRGWHE